MEGKKLSESQCVHLSSFLFSCLGQNKTGKRPTWIWPRVLLYVPPRHWKSAWVMGHRDPRVTSWVTAWVTAWVTYLCHCFSHLLVSPLGPLEYLVHYLSHNTRKLRKQATFLRKKRPKCWPKRLLKKWPKVWPIWGPKDWPKWWPKEWPKENDWH